MSSRVVVFGDVQEAQSNPTAKQETTDHTQWDKEGKLVTVDPARRRTEREEERGREREKLLLKHQKLTKFQHLQTDSEDAMTWGPRILVLWSQNETKHYMAQDW